MEVKQEQETCLLDSLKKQPDIIIRTVFWFLLTYFFFFFFFSGFGRSGMGPVAWSRQGCRGEQRKESSLWCHGRDPWGCMGWPHNYVREETVTSGTYFSVLWKCFGGLYSIQMSLNLKPSTSYRYSVHCNFTLLYMFITFLKVEAIKKIKISRCILPFVPSG